MVSAVATAGHAEMLALTCLLIGLWCTLSSLEWLADLRSLHNGAALGWDLLSLRRGRIYRSEGLARLFDARWFGLVPALRLAAGLMLLSQPAPGLTLAALLLVAGCSVLLGLRLPAVDGADKIGLVSTCAAILIATGLVLDDPLIAVAGILWGGGQLTIAYTAAGVSKLLLPLWRDGSAVIASMTSYTYGHRFAHAAVQHRELAIALSWAVILAETLFPVALLAPLPVLLVALAGFALFHLATAVFMGLNTYVWAFMTAYPCVILLSRMLRHFIGWDPA